MSPIHLRCTGRIVTKSRPESESWKTWSTECTVLPWRLASSRSSTICTVLDHSMLVFSFQPARTSNAELSASYTFLFAYWEESYVVPMSFVMVPRDSLESLDKTVDDDSYQRTDAVDFNEPFDTLDLSDQLRIPIRKRRWSCNILTASGRILYVNTCCDFDTL